ncbi:hypothetical protein AGABI1DRAFT_133632 [Agaricus bisporus var. burnettii JB137-S8]|uniref:Uncharacterized protein n=1 Tax=Agaricus bisporus var. burnettii (strain JB137-S8 / ATCC MYA-4627 / FGSC 10392) TaxID=597362 RepID=K5WFU4_AGABU|nr:uncharacterized protein AGABI1DRAFT_133632 [Agaricus bisporus var. burnettii JB137-S8]EKM74101.1 hypothetical protein AGABI1DRAFT_133632 [Agaricus bisporus var. burnettii JB137-S8]
MPRKAKQQPAPASTPYLSRPPLQAPPPPAHPNAARLTVSDIETMLNPEAIMDAVRNWGIAPATAVEDCINL